MLSTPLTGPFSAKRALVSGSRSDSSLVMREKLDLSSLRMKRGGLVNEYTPKKNAKEPI